MLREELSFYKMSGAGNDFVIFNAFNSASEEALKVFSGDLPEFARKICARGLGVGADGLVILRRDPKHDFKWDFLNADGSDAEMCGNAARCAVSLMFQLGLAQTRMSFLTGAGIVEGTYNPDKSISVSMPMTLENSPETVEISVDGVAVRGWRVNTGVPHFVIETLEAKPSERLKRLARSARHHSAFGPRGTNVTFLCTSEGKARSFSYERGVEDFTLACGTGAVAAGIILSEKQGSWPEEFAVQVPGGDLYISLDKKSRRPRLRGPAQIIYIGQLNRGAFHVEV